jgi:hypothetical protein
MHEIPAPPHTLATLPGWHRPALSQHPKHVAGPHGAVLASCGSPPELADDEAAPELELALEELASPPELEPELVDEPPPASCAAPPDDVEELLALLEDEPPELDELEAGAASVSERRPPSSAGDCPSPTPIGPRASPLSGALSSAV